MLMVVSHWVNTSEVVNSPLFFINIVGERNSLMWLKGNFCDSTVLLQTLYNYVVKGFFNCLIVPKNSFEIFPS